MIVTGDGAARNITGGDAVLLASVPDSRAGGRSPSSYHDDSVEALVKSWTILRALVSFHSGYVSPSPQTTFLL